MIDKFLVHPMILRGRGPMRKNRARYRAGSDEWPLHVLEDGLFGEGELLVREHP
ncbi:hypothetical protein SUDANB132_04253 [Streptomyces sp. enrichment culture]